MYIGEIIKEYRAKHKLSQRAFASMANVTAAYVSALENIYNPRNNKPYSVTTEKARDIANGMNMSVDELLSKLNKNQEFEINIAEKQPSRIPILATFPSRGNSKILGYIYDEEYNSDDYFAFRVTDDSMQDILCNGDIAIAKKQEEFSSADTCVVVVNGTPMVREVIHTNSGIMLIPRNRNKYETIEFSKKEIKSLPIEIKGIVVEARNKGCFK